MPNSNYILQFREENCTNRKFVGAKAARLADMVQMDLPVPPGFAVTVETFRNYCKQNQINIEGISRPEERNAKKEKILSGEFSPLFIKELEENLDKLSGKHFAVRSSAIDEDGGGASMAGMFSTFLYTERAQVLQKIRECWASAYTEHVAVYSGNNGILDTTMAVAVQEQIDPIAAGVLFTWDPIHKNGDEMVVEWVHGIGEQLVSGEVTPERFIIYRKNMATEGNIGELNVSQAKELAKYGLLCEKKLGGPADLEWCIDSRGLFIVQTRPITTIIGSNSAIWTNVNISENFPGIQAPFAWSFVKDFYSTYMKSTLSIFGFSGKDLTKVNEQIEGLVGIHHGHVYYNIGNWYAIIDVFPFNEIAKRCLNNYIGQNVPLSMQNNQYKLQDSFWNKIRKNITVIKNIFFIRNFTKLELKKIERIFPAKRKRWEEARLAKNLDDIFAGYTDVMQTLQFDWKGPCFGDLMVMIFPGILEALLASKMQEGSQQLLVEVLQGIDVKSEKPLQLIRKMALYIKKNPSLQLYLTGENFIDLKNQLDHKGAELYNEFMDDFGCRTIADCTLTTSTYCEKPELYWRHVLNSFNSLDKNQPHSHKNIKEASKDAKEKALKLFPAWQRFFIKKIIKYARESIANREEGRLKQSILYGEVRLIAMSLGKKLHEIGSLECIEDIFFLSPLEIKALIHGQLSCQENLTQIISMRKDVFNIDDELNLPTIFSLEKGHTYIPRKNQCTSNKGSILYGTPVSRGIIEGKVRIVKAPDEKNAINPGEILAARSTDPGWTPLFMIAGGIILENGGMLSHGAIVARELGLPAVAGVPGLLSTIKDGELIRLDGSTGEIHLLEKQC